LSFIADLSILVFDSGEKIVKPISCFLRSATTIATVVLIAGHAAHSQQPNTASNDANAIAQSYRDVDVKMTDPDPDKRLAYLETIVAEGNAGKIQRAIRIAVASQDESVRALGFRAYIVAMGSVQFDFLLTPQEKQQIDDRHAGRNTLLPRYLDSLFYAGPWVKIAFEQPSLTSVRGFVKQESNRFEFTMRGERLTFSGPTSFGGGSPTCSWDIKPTRELKIAGTLTCLGFPRPVQLAASMF
jgi:hypothetical protein